MSSPLRIMTISEGELAFTRWTIRILIGALILSVLVSLYFAISLSESKAQVKELSKEVEDLKAKLVLYEKPLGDTQVVVDKVSKLIATLGKKPSADAERLAILEVGLAAKYSFDLPTGLAISFQESKWKESVVSVDYSSIGVKQINFDAWKPRFKEMTIPRLQNPRYNIDIGYRLVSEHLKQYGTLHKALQRYRGSTSPEVNQQYADDVLKIASAIRKHLDYPST